MREREASTPAPPAQKSIMDAPLGGVPQEVRLDSGTPPMGASEENYYPSWCRGQDTALGRAGVLTPAYVVTPRPRWGEGSLSSDGSDRSDGLDRSDESDGSDAQLSLFSSRSPALYRTGRTPAPSPSPDHRHATIRKPNGAKHPGRGAFFHSGKTQMRQPWRGGQLDIFF